MKHFLFAKHKDIYASSLDSIIVELSATKKKNDDDVILALRENIIELLGERSRKLEMFSFDIF